MKLGWSSGKKPLASGITATAQPAASASFTIASLASAMRTLTPTTMTGLAAALHISSVVSSAARIEDVLLGLRGGSWKGMGRETGSSAMLLYRNN